MARRLLALLLVAAVAGAGAFAYAHRHALRRLVAGPAAVVTPAAPPPDSVQLSVDPRADRHPISPLIYGVADWDPATHAGTPATLDRWGGNPSSRYNWVLGNAWNAASDWNFANVDKSDAPGSASDHFVAGNRAAGAASLITIPALGWVASSNNNADRSVGVPNDGGPATGPNGQIAGYDPTANRVRTSVPSLPQKPGPLVLNPSPQSPVVYQDEWVNHLVHTFGTGASGGVSLYAIDNEPMLWSSTHRDVHPARVGYDELASTFNAYATAVKRVDPTAQVLGPESCCWYDFKYSELDRGTDNFATHADHDRHGMDLIPWFLQSTRQRDQAAGRRTLDVLTVHWYPQANGVYSSGSNPELDALRLRQTRSLWDPGYRDESWINDNVGLLPRLHSWVDSYYPGTRIGITEYDFGGGESASAGLAEAEALGWFGRDDVYLASCWCSPKPGSTKGSVFQLFRNADGRSGGFGDTSIRATSSAPEVVSVFGATQGSTLTVLVSNKQLDRPQHVDLKLPATSGPLQQYRLAGDYRQGITAATADAAGGHYSADLPPGSLTLLRVQLAS